MKIINNSVIYEVLAKQYLRSVLDISFTESYKAKTKTIPYYFRPSIEKKTLYNSVIFPKILGSLPYSVTCISSFKDILLPCFLCVYNLNAAKAAAAAAAAAEEGRILFLESHF